MTKENIKLLLKDLCARLPYGVKVQYEPYTFDLNNFEVSSTISETILEVIKEEWKPYLRPMSSMTDAEKKDFPFPYYFEWIDSNFSLLCSNDEVCADIGFDEMYKIMDWLNAHHFDYRGLIEKGLAIEAPEGMYKI